MLGRHAALLVELDEDDRVWHSLAVGGVDAVVDDLVGVDRALAGDLLPLPLERLTEGAGGARRVAEVVAGAALLEDEAALGGGLQIAQVLRVVLWDADGDAQVLGHVDAPRSSRSKVVRR